MANLSNINGKFVVEQTTGYVGVGTTDPNFLIEAAGANSEIALNSTSASIYRLRSTSSDSFIITKNGVGDRLVIAGNGDATFSGNVGIGVTPVVHYGGYEVLDIGNSLSLISNNTSTNVSILTNNAYLNSGATAWVRKVADEATMYEQVSGEHRFSNAGSAAAGVAISWSERMRIDSSGNVLINATSKYNSYPAGFITQTIATDAGDVCPILELVGNRSANPGNQNAMIQFFNKTSTAVEVGRIASSQGSATNSGELRFYTTNAGTISQRMIIDSSGNVGINDTNPNTANLSIKGQSSGVSANFPMLKLLGQNTSSDGLHITTTGSGNDHYAIKVATGGNSSAFNVTNAGNVGIGTTSPSSKLHVQGGAIGVTTGQKIGWIYNPGSDNNMYNYIRTADNGGVPASALEISGSNWTSGNVAGVKFTHVTGGEIMTIMTGGNVGIGTTSPNTALQVNQNTTVPLLVHRPSNTNFDPHGIGFSTRNDTVNGGFGDVRSGIFSDYNGDLFLAAATSSIASSPLTYSRLFIEGANGNVGIGTDSPTAKLDIDGDVRYRGDTYAEFTYNGSGNYSNGTIYTVANSSQLTVNGIYQLVMYLDDFGVGGSTYFCWFCSVPFYWVTTGTNRTVSQTLPPLIGTGHAIGTIPTFYITQELGTQGGQSKVRFDPNNNWTGINGTSGKKFQVYIKRLGG